MSKYKPSFITRALLLVGCFVISLAFWSIIAIGDVPEWRYGAYFVVSVISSFLMWGGIVKAASDE